MPLAPPATIAACPSSPDSCCQWEVDLYTSLDIINVIVVNIRDSNDKDTHLTDCGMDDPWRNVGIVPRIHPQALRLI